jgi:hypothetical protein
MLIWLSLFLFYLQLDISQCCLFNEIMFDESSSVLRGLSPPPELFQNFSKMRPPTILELAEMEECSFMNKLGVPIEYKLPSDMIDLNFSKWEDKIEAYKKRKLKQERRERIQADKAKSKQQKALRQKPRNQR